MAAPVIRKMQPGEPRSLIEASEANKVINAINGLVDMEIVITTTGRSGITYADGRALLAINANDIAAKLP